MFRIAWSKHTRTGRRMILPDASYQNHDFHPFSRRRENCVVERRFPITLSI